MPGRGAPATPAPAGPRPALNFQAPPQQNFSGPAPGGAFAPAKLSDPAPGGAFAPAKLSGPAPGGAPPAGPPRLQERQFRILLQPIEALFLTIFKTARYFFQL